jgi:hypothetical protein
MLAVLTGLLGTLIGLFFGHRLSLGRERRKEFNEVASPIYEDLEKQLITASSGAFPMSANDFAKSSFISLKPHLTRLKVSKLDNSIEKYEEAKNKCGSFLNGYYEFHSPQILVSAIQELQNFVRRK